MLNACAVPLVVTRCSLFFKLLSWIYNKKCQMTDFYGWFRSFVELAQGVCANCRIEATASTTNNFKLSILRKKISLIVWLRCREKSCKSWCSSSSGRASGLHRHLLFCLASNKITLLSFLESLARAIKIGWHNLPAIKESIRRRKGGAVTLAWAWERKPRFWRPNKWIIFFLLAKVTLRME